MKEKSIKEIIDTYLKKWVDAGINNHPIPIEDERLDVRLCIQRSRWASLECVAHGYE